MMIMWMMVRNIKLMCESVCEREMGKCFVEKNKDAGGGLEHYAL